MMKLMYGVFGILLLTVLGFRPETELLTAPKLLSEYELFEGEMRLLRPAADVLPYALNSPLFSDYSTKYRFVKLPGGTAAVYDPTEVMDFPVGTILAKTFAYPANPKRPDGEERLVETRILVHEAKGWRAYPYVWNEAQTDAKLKLLGDNQEVNLRTPDGKKRTIRYHVPNANECKGCHNYAGGVRPIGPTARQLNGDFAYDDGTQNQLDRWAERGILRDLPTERPALVRYEDATADLHQRARAYLDANCGHCHRPDGPAGTSGMFLHYAETDPAAWGVRKPPVAAGRGAGNRRYGIEPGKPDASILTYRMASTDPGERMPELGRSVVHEEGLALIRDWIAAMEE